MTHHTTLLEKLRSDRRVLESPATRCNGCGREANQWPSLGEENFVPIEGKTLDGEQAYACFCSDCCKNESIDKKDVKTVITFSGDETAGFTAGTVYPRDLTSAEEDIDREETGISSERSSDKEIVESGTTIVEVPKTVKKEEEPAKEKEKKSLFGRK